MIKEKLKIEDFTFPIARKKGCYYNKFGIPITTNKVNAIIRKDNSEFISYVKPTMKTVPNEKIINEAIKGIEKIGYKYEINQKQSFVENNKMRLTLDFPELEFKGHTVNVNLINSYDGTASIQFIFGAIRGICSNGMVFGHVLKRYKRKHTHGFMVDNFIRHLELAYKKIPEMNERLSLLEVNEFNFENSKEYLEKNFGKKLTKYVEEKTNNPDISTEHQRVANMLILYNLITYYISHNIKLQNRLRYEELTSKMFGL